MGEGEQQGGSDDLFEDLDKFFAPIKDVDWPEPDETPAPARAATASQEHVSVRPPGSSPEPGEPVAPDRGPEAASQPEPPAAPEHEAAWYDTQSMEAATGEGPEEDDTIVVPTAETPGQAGLFAGADQDPSEADVEAAAEYFAEGVRSEGEGPAGEPGAFAHPAEGGDELSDTEAGAGEIEEDILSDLEEPAAPPRTVKVGAEGFGGPSWQEPTSVEVGADTDRRGERDVPAAFVTGVALAVVAFGSLLIGKPAFAVIATIVALIGQFELFVAARKSHKQPATAVGLVSGALIMWAAYARGEGGVLAMLAVGIIAVFLWFMVVPGVHRKDTLLNIGLTIANVAYIPVLASFLLLTLGVGGSDGKALVAAVIGLTFVFDTAAFLAGSILGGSSIRRPLAPDTSPKKSWEGLIIAAFITFLASVAFVASFVAPLEGRKLDTFLLAIVISAAATFGDLAESLIKRDLKIKDMGGILPGHGGVLDRIDSLLFAAPAAYLLFRVIFT